MHAFHAQNSLKRQLAAGSALAVLALAAPAALAQEETPNIVPHDGLTPTDVLDTPVDVTGVGMFYRADGFVCSGTLINPRTVLFAAHCVNDRDAADYGGAVPAAWSFGVDALPGFIAWINGFQSDPDMAVYNVAAIRYHLDSLARPQGFGFLEGDVAISVLDTPAGNIPTWALLFSALPAPDAYTQETGSGYHVNLVGYGRTGNGTFGAYQGIDWRRRAAENYIGALASLNDRNQFLFGPGDYGLPQNLYQLDFDDPTRTNPYDFDLFRGDAAPNEATTAGGDSGGPLILDAAGNAGINEDLVIGVLSGGSRFFGPQVFSSYGTSNFYQPLYLFWDWIAENNPYRYVSAVAGDGAWEDGNHWVTLLDPNYRVIDANGNVVNGIPDSPGEGIGDTSDPWGEICFAPFVCTTLETGTTAPYADDTAGMDGNTLGRIDASGLGSITIDGVEMPAKRHVQDSATSATTDETANEPGPRRVLPTATIENGLPGATGFTVNNANADPSSIGRYFDVTLSAAGTTTLSSTVEIDRFTLAGMAAALDIETGASLTSLIEVMHMAGSMNVDGTLTTYGDYLLLTGLLTGSGTINTPYLTNVGALIAPGGLDDVGTLTVNGNVILASASGLAINYGETGVDRLVVSGTLNLGGTLMLVPTGGLPRYGDGGTFLQAGDITGSFDVFPSELPGALYTTFTFANGQANFSIGAQSLSTQTTYTNHFQASLGAALDSARDTDYDALADIFGPVDLISGDALATALNSLSPFEMVMFDRTTRTHTDTLTSALIDQISRGGSSAASDISVALASVEQQQDGLSTPLSLSGAKALFRNPFTGGDDAPAPGFRAFSSVGYMQSDARSVFGAGTSEIQGEYSLVGLEANFATGWRFGGAVGLAGSDMNGPSAIGSITGDSSTTQVSAFAGYRGDRLDITGFFSFANSDMTAQRGINLGGALGSSTARLHANSKGGGLVANYRLSAEDAAVQIVPTASLAVTNYAYDAIDTATHNSLTLAEREIDSIIARAGAHFRFGGGTWRPIAYAGLAHDLGDERETYSASFAAAPGVSFGTTESIGNDRVWYDVSVGLEREFANGATLSLSAYTQINREYLEQTGGTLAFSVPF